MAMKQMVFVSFDTIQSIFLSSVWILIDKENKIG